MACDMDHTGNLPRPKIEALENSQRDFWRHKCAGCAYEMGRADAGVTEDNLRRRVQQLHARVEELEGQIRSVAK